MSTLDDVGAQLKRVDPKDLEALAPLRAALLEVCGDLDVEPYYRFQIGEVVRLLDPILKRVDPDPAAALAQAVAMLDAALGPAVAVVVPNAPLGLKTPGDLTAATTPALRDAWMAALGDGKGAVVLDLESTHHMDALGLSLVLGLFKTCQSRGRPFSVDGIGPQLQPVFRRLNLTRLFPVKGGSL